jgi:predicted dithiol-disulfide oxidoreductase (DUF899 family)
MRPRSLVTKRLGSASSPKMKPVPCTAPFRASDGGLENTIGTYNYLDLVPKGRDEDGLPSGMDWLRLKDQYGE